ncbi:MAG: hypothetical protein JSR21_11415 [Proteobacteria bacterium]|nr:hypothetical protein [Pseudomonadota bacterium]
MKITVIGDARGKLVAIVHGHVSEHEKEYAQAASSHAPAVPRVTLMPRPGQAFHEVVAPADLRGKPHDALRRWVMSHGPLKGAPKGSPSS